MEQHSFLQLGHSHNSQSSEQYPRVNSLMLNLY
jgi:hypothetical protein